MPPSPSRSSAGSSLHHRAASYAVYALVGSILLSLFLRSALAESAHLLGIVSTILGIVTLSAIPAGILALCGIPRHGKTDLLWKGLVGVGVPLLLAGLTLPAYLKARASSQELRLQRVVEELSKDLPRMLDASTRLDQVTLTGDQTVIVDFSIVNYGLEDMDLDFWQTARVPQIIAASRNSAFGQLAGQGVTVTFRYVDRDGVRFSEFVLPPPAAAED